MPIFQKSIVDKYLATLEADVIEKAFNSYKEVYSPEKIKRIKKLKEEQYQGGFLNDIFGSVLGYTIDPEVNYNIELEKKNETNSKKADGAILQEEKVLGVIELKSNKTKNLESIKDQAFGYKNNHKGCKYVISSNFHKLRFYVDDATEYEEFDLYNLDKETFKKFYLYLRKEGLLDKNIPKLLKEETKFHEENISKQLYKDYSSFKNKFFENIVKNNPQHDKLLLFKKSQKFLDRILFVLFAEDKELIPTNAISRIVESWALADDLHYKPLYELFTILFEHLNVGHIYKSGYEIPAYNGGLFAPDEVLDNLKVDDEILKDDLLTLSKYDFNTDVDVNILGHIFEHSLSEIEEIEAELKGEVADKTKGKRKKDGVFYTPKYITKYIVDNTVGKLCTEKKKELGLDIDFDIQDYQKSNGSVNAKGKELFHTLESYKEWLLQLKILDPACGSGAFLNEALSFLIEEHKNIDDLISELTNTPLRLFDTEKAILENNIFGVDINDESVEIAKLSLWLRTAQKGRKLSNLNNNIKCGNSLIDDPDVAGDKAFKWEEEFPQVFEKGGFDVVIGNPPYGARITDNEKDYFRKEYPELEFKIDTYSIFVLKIYRFTKQNGIAYYIIPNTLLDNFFEQKVRVEILTKSELIEIVDLDDKVFEDAVVHAMIIGIRNYYKENYNVKISSTKGLGSIFEEIPVNYFKTQEKMVFAIRNYRNKDILNKLSVNSKRLKEIIDIRQTIKTGNDKIHIVNTKLKENYKPVIAGRDMNKWLIKSPGLYVNYGKHLACPRNPKIFEQPKILIREAGDKITATYDDTGYYIMSSLYACILIDNHFNLKYILSLLNSSLFQFQLKLIAFDKTKGAFTKARIFHYYELPTKIIDLSEQKPFVEKADLMIVLTGNFNRITTTFTNFFKSKFSIEKPSTKLQNWNELEFGDFIKELNKTIKKVGGEKLSKMDEMDWLEVFETKKEEALKLKAEIDKTDKEIDQMVYELYGLTEEEIQIVENS
tara:strand:- start:643 stop:3636 length:2994 start_codon:yes stop_codon:yes gene_type:complete